jgi:hypothetical protein
MCFTRDPTTGAITIDQHRYIDTLLDRHNMANCNGVHTPALPGDHAPLEPPHAPLPLMEAAARDFRSLVGGLLYIAVCTRPDIAFAVSQLARAVTTPTSADSQAAKRVLRYLKSHPDGITFRPQPLLCLTGYADASYAADPHTRRSTTGYVFFVAGGAVAWRSKLQSVVAMSTTEAEYIAACHAALEAVPLRELLANLDFPMTEATIIYEDNQAALQLSVDPIAQQRTKHIAVRYHKIRELVAQRIIDMVSISTQEQVADLLTKALGRVTHRKHTNTVLGML